MRQLKLSAKRFPMKYKSYVIALSAIILILNLCAWFSIGFCDWYTLHITPIWVNTLGRFMNLFPFSVGEILIVLGILLSIIAFVLLVLRNHFSGRSHTFFKLYGAIFLNVCLILTLNCSTLYHCTQLDPNPVKSSRTYTVLELETLRNHIVTMCNLLADTMPRDEQGYVVYDGDLQAEAKDALHGISDLYPKLAGYYPNVKPMFFSALMSQSYMAGYYFPFSMEANCNKNMYITNYPDTYCHELSHLHGYLFEEEAGMLSFLACTHSEDTFFQYCGYLAVLGYVDKAYIRSIHAIDSEEGALRYLSQLSCSDAVKSDFIFLKPETWEKVEEHAVLKTETVKSISNTFTETTLKLNGISDGMAVYDGVVSYLLEYYEGTLYR